MNSGRKYISDHLRGMATVEVGDDFVARENAKYYRTLANKNDKGTLTIHESQCVMEMFEAENPLTVDMGTERWVEVHRENVAMSDATYQNIKAEHVKDTFSEQKALDVDVPDKLWEQSLKDE